MLKSLKYIIILSSIYFSGCATSNNLNLDIDKFNQKITTKIDIPKSCQQKYNNLIPRVAVSDFINNSTFAKADIKQTITKNKIKTGIGVNPIFVGIDAKNNKIKYSTNRKINAKLSKTATSLLENTIMNIGGIQLYTRENLKQINKELKLQDSGLIDENSIVEFGKLAGVEYIITGSIDNISQKMIDNSAISEASIEIAQHSKNKKIKAGSLLATILTTTTDGMRISTTATIKLIKVSTGKIIFSKTISDTINIGKIYHPTFDQIIGAVKVALLHTLPSIKKSLIKYIPIKGYITQIRQNNNQTIAQINIGSKENSKPNKLYRVYKFEEFTDPLTNQKKCDMIKTDILLLSTNEISDAGTWTQVIQTNSSSTLKLNQLVKQEP